MRPIYFILRVFLPYVMRIFYRRTKTINSQKVFRTPTIFVSNHPSAFIDPLVVANFQWAIFHFMVRSDIFKPWLRPVTWACHMVPIYRMAEDGKESLEKNSESFREAIKVLQSRRSLILFGEGYTDNTFIRCLKPIKKGPARIAFSAMVTTNWQQDIMVQPTGLNYTHPKYFRSDVVIQMAPLIHLKDYKELYDESPAKAMTQLTRDIEKSMQEQITYIENKALAPFHENIMIITRKGMNQFHSDLSIPLEKRCIYSQELARRINAEYSDEKEDWTNLKSELEHYFKLEKKEKINDNWVYQFSRTKGKQLFQRFAYLLLVLPIFLIGAMHSIVPFLLVKFFVEKIFKRDVFWSGVKMLLGTVVIAAFNLPAIWLFYDYIYESYWLGFLYYLIVPVFTGVIAYDYFAKLKDTIKILKAPKSVLEKFAHQRTNLVEKIKNLGL